MAKPTELIINSQIEVVFETPDGCISEYSGMFIAQNEQNIVVLTPDGSNKLIPKKLVKAAKCWVKFS